MYLVSVIVPVYNSAPYLERCINSILSQSFSELELILVDDGSIDSSADICNYYADQDIRVKVIHKKNGGVSSARNLGIEYASGRYITFVDSDDYVAKDYLLQLVRNASDLTICGFETYDEYGELLSTLSCEPKLFETRSDIAYPWMYSKLILYSPYCKLFRADIIKGKQIRFPIDISWGEDAMFVADYLVYVEKIIITNYLGYCHIRYEGNWTLSTSIKENILDMVVRSREYCIEKMRLTASDAYAEVSAICKKDICSNCASFIYMLLNSKEIRLKDKRRLLRRFLCVDYVQHSFENANEYYHGGFSRFINGNAKCADQVLFKFGNWKLYKIVWRVCYRIYNDFVPSVMKKYIKSGVTLIKRKGSYDT